MFYREAVLSFLDNVFSKDVNRCSTLQSEYREGGNHCMRFSNMVVTARAVISACEKRDVNWKRITETAGID